jgi:protein-disulfide isomerase
MPQLTQAVNEKDHIQGSLNSPINLVEYGDYQCLVCKMALSIIKQLNKEFGNNMCFVFRHFPLRTSHPFAFEAAKAAEAAALQNKFWEMHELIYAKQFELNEQIWPQLAEELKLDVEKFKQDFHSSSIEEKVQNTFLAGVRSGVNGTPCFFINGTRFDGDASYDNLKQALANTKNS